MSDLELKLLDLIRSDEDPKTALLIAVRVIADYLSARQNDLDNRLTTT